MTGSYKPWDEKLIISFLQVMRVGEEEGSGVGGDVDTLHLIVVNTSLKNTHK